MGGDENESQWHLDRKVPIAFIMFFAIQTVTLVYIGTSWKADVDSRLAYLERSEDRASGYETRITVLEQGFLRIREDLAEIKTLIRSRTVPLESPQP